jgi:hypothetical protein
VICGEKICEMRGVERCVGGWNDKMRRVGDAICKRRMMDLVSWASSLECFASDAEMKRCRTLLILSGVRSRISRRRMMDGEEDTSSDIEWNLHGRARDEK